MTSLTLAGDGIRPAARWVAPAFCVAYALLLLAPWRFVFPMPGIEPSWAEVIAFAAREGWQWGRDVVFTYGPLGYLSIGSFADAQLPSLLVVTTALSLLFGLGVAVLLPRESPVAALLLGVVALVPAAIMGRFVFGMLGLLAALCHFSPPTRARQATAIALAAGAGVAALAHLYAAAAGLAMLILVDASRALTSRRWPVHVATFAGAALVAYVAGGQDITGLPSFLRGTFEVISGYGGAMSLPGSKLEIAAYVLASVVVVGLVARHERATRGSALVVAVVALWLFMALKIGFVRHDQHSAGAWAMMAVATSAYAATRWPLPTARATCVALVAVAVGSIVAAMSVATNGPMRRTAEYALQVLLVNPAQALTDGLHALAGPAQWRAAWRAQADHARADLRRAVPLPDVQGTVDVIPNVQASALAHGMRYRPRPVFQDYAAYTPWLAERNRAYYQGPEAAQFILFRPEPIDNRYPMLEQSSSAIDLLTRYDPVRLDRDFLVLARRDVPLRGTLVDGRFGTARFGEWIEVKSGAAPVMLWIDVEKGLAGHIASLALRQPVLEFTVRFADGTERESRLVDGMARAGFLLSPMIATPNDLTALAVGLRELGEARRVVAFRVNATPFGQRFYRDDIRFNYASLALDERAARARAAAMGPWLQRFETASAMAAGAPKKPPWVDARGSELFAHAPVSIALPVQTARRVRLAYGLLEGAYTSGGMSDGVCFRVSSPARVLFERCLDPRERPEDRGPQWAEFDAGIAAPSTLVFETQCRASCAWDWSYWKDIDVEP